MRLHESFQKLLMMKAAEDLKQQQLLKEQERQRVLQERIIPLPNVDSVDDHGQFRVAHVNDAVNSWTPFFTCKFYAALSLH